MADKILDLGSNGVTNSSVYEEDNQIITLESMPANSIDKILEANKRDQDLAKQRLSSSDLGVIGARIPIVTHHKWRKEWKSGPKQWGQPWHVFLKRKLNSPEYANLRFMTL